MRTLRAAGQDNQPQRQGRSVQRHACHLIIFVYYGVLYHNLWSDDFNTVRTKATLRCPTFQFSYNEASKHQLFVITDNTNTITRASLGKWIHVAKRVHCSASKVTLCLMGDCTRAFGPCAGGESPRFPKERRNPGYAIHVSSVLKAWTVMHQRRKSASRVSIMMLLCPRGKTTSFGRPTSRHHLTRALEDERPARFHGPPVPAMVSMI